ncbi:MAG: type-F conjugative transfer system pilin assembly protein TrbC, partial [Pseudomonadota bacterium]
ADDRDFDKAAANAEAASAEAAAAIGSIGEEGVTSSLPSFEEAVRRAEGLSLDLLPSLGQELSDPATLNAVGELMNNAQSMAADLGIGGGEEILSIYIFASFSMPDASLKAVIEQAELAGAAVVLRGLVDDSVEATMQAVSNLYGEDEQVAGAVIDPTLFERFSINQVPSFVVSESPAQRCMSDADCPIPDYVKIAGDVPLLYALERISASHPELDLKLAPARRSLQPGRTW